MTQFTDNGARICTLASRGVVSLRPEEGGKVFDNQWIVDRTEPDLCTTWLMTSLRSLKTDEILARKSFDLFYEHVTPLKCIM